jgi:hypothetical protein
MALCVQRLQLLNFCTSISMPVGAGASRFSLHATHLGRMCGDSHMRDPESLTFHHNNMVRADPITNCEVAITNMKNPKIRRFVKALVGFPPGGALSLLSPQSCCFCGGCRAFGWWLPEWLPYHICSQPTQSAT